jgi:hypothetical protein
MYFSPNIIRMIKSKRKRWTKHVAYTEEKKIASEILTRNSEGKRPLGRPTA